MEDPTKKPNCLKEIQKARRVKKFPQKLKKNPRL